MNPGRKDARTSENSFKLSYTYSKIDAILVLENFFKKSQVLSSNEWNCGPKIHLFPERIRAKSVRIVTFFVTKSVRALSQLHFHAKSRSQSRSFTWLPGSRVMITLNPEISLPLGAPIFRKEKEIHVGIY
jgi:hypothetical protein